MPLINPRVGRQYQSRGFTLLETLVVLMLIGLIAATITPRLAGAFDSVAFALAREKFELDLSTLSYQAHKRGADLVLRSIDPAVPTRVVRSSIMSGSLYQPVELSIPEGWSVEVSSPIVYRASGYCAGGTITVSLGSITETYVLRPPLCAVESKS